MKTAQIERTAIYVVVKGHVFQFMEQIYNDTY